MNEVDPGASASPPTAQRHCPLCLAIDRAERPLFQHVALRLDGLHESWRCKHCLSSFHPPHDRSREAENFLPA